VFLEGDRTRADAHVLVVEVPAEVLVDPVSHGLGIGDDAVRAGLTVRDVEGVGEQVQDREVVFDDEHRPVRVVRGEFLDEAGGDHALSDVEVRRDLVEEVEVGVACQTGGDRDALELAAGDRADVLVHHRADVEPVDERVEGAPLVGPLEEIAGVAVELGGYLVDVLWLPRDGHRTRLERAQVLLESGPPEAVEHALPVRGRLVVAEVRDALARERVHRGRLPDSVRTENTGDASRLWRREPVQCERVLTVPVDGVVFEFGGEVDDLDRVERALLNADATRLAETQLFGDADLVRVALVGVGPALGDALFARSIRRAVVRTLVVTPVRLTPVEVHDGDAVVGHLRASPPR